MSDWPYHISCRAHQAVSYTRLCIARTRNIPCYASPDHTLYHIMPTRPYHMACHAHQVIPYTMPCPPDYTVYHCQAIPYTMPCPPWYTIYHCHAMTTRPYHIPYHARLVIPYTMPCHGYFSKSCHLSKGVKGLVTRCTIACK